MHIQPEAVEALQQYHWPGNVRELQNYVERAVVMAEGDELTVDLLPPEVSGKSNSNTTRRASRGTDLNALTVDVVEQGLLELAEERENLHTKIVDRIENHANFLRELY